MFAPIRKRAKRFKRSNTRLVRFTIYTFLLAGAVGFAAGVYLDDLGLFDFSTSQLNAITHWTHPDNTIILDRDNQKIAELFSFDHIFVPYDQIPKDMIHAIVSIEDRTYWQHLGVDFKSIVRAFAIYVGLKKNRHQQGASTLTQQVVRHFLLNKDKTLHRKIQEMFLAIKLETLIDKEKILEIYTNALFLGNGAYGVGAAAKRYFNRPLQDLKLHELALISGLFQSPSRYNPQSYPERARERQLMVLKAMYRCNFLSAQDLKYWAKQPIVYAPYKPALGTNAPFFVDYIHESTKKLLGLPSLKNRGYRVYTSLDPRLQKLAEDAVGDAKDNLAHSESVTRPKVQGKKVVLEAALLATDPRNGEVLAMVGGRDYKRSQFNRTVSALRQPGSAFKPIVYSLALQSGFRWSDMIYVSPVTINGNYRPHTPESDYFTPTTLLRAFYRSMNTPTVELGEKLGLNNIIEHAKTLGISTPLKTEFGTILGASETSMLDLARVNGVFANAGEQVDPTGILRIEDMQGNVLYEQAPANERSRAVLSPQIAYLTAEGMRQVLIRGTAAKAGYLSPYAAGKTGTSNESKDNWFTGYSSSLVAVVWVGSDDSEPIGGNAMGGTLALPIWEEFMTAAFKIRPPSNFRQPNDVQSYLVDPEYGDLKETGVKMWFLKSSLPPIASRPREEMNSTQNFRDPLQ